MYTKWVGFVLMLASSACVVGSTGNGDGGGDADLGGMSGSDGGGRSDGGMIEPGGKTRYPAGALHSPMSTAVVDRLKAVLAASPHKREVFAKIGDSITNSTTFLNCFSGTNIMWGAESALEPSRAYFDRVIVDGTATSFDRDSICAQDGWNAGTALMGSPSPLAQEVAAIDPAFAVVMYGTNDTYDGGQFAFEKNLRGVIDSLLAGGVIPIVSTIPPRGDSAAMNDLVPEMNAIIRALAESRQVPLVDYWQTLIGLPSYGLAGDGVHPQAYGSGACWFTSDALQFGVNQRNRVTMQALDRVKRFVVDSAAPEAAPPALTGAGTFANPRIIDVLPFVDSDDTSTSTSSTANVYSCGTQNEGGPEIVYKLELSAPTRLRARVYCDDGVDVDLHWLDAASPTSCLTRNDKTIEVTAGPGTFWLAADTFVSAGTPKPGKYRLTIVAVP
jgi:hypothetical protein